MDSSINHKPQKVMYMSGNAHSSKRNDHSYETLNRNNPHRSNRNDHSYETLNRNNPHQPKR